MAGLKMPADGQHHDHGGHAEGDHDGGQDQGLRQGVGVAVGGADDRGGVQRKAAGGEEEEVDGVAEEGEAEDHREGALAQHQVKPDGGEQADGRGEKGFHQRGSSRSKARVFGRSPVFSASRESEASARRTAPRTQRKTPRSKIAAVASSNSPAAAGGHRCSPR
jgi:hypothetical protein